MNVYRLLNNLNAFLKNFVGSWRATHLVGLFMFALAALILDAAENPTAVYWRSPFGVSAIVYAAWLVLTGIYLVTRSKARYLVLYAMPMALYAFYTVMAVLFDPGAPPPTKIAAAWACFAVILVVYIGAQDAA